MAAKSPKKTKKHAYRLVMYDFIQFKRMIGKKLVRQWSGIISDEKHQTSAEKVKKQLINKKQRSGLLPMRGFLNDGVLYIFFGIERMIAINSLSYATIKQSDYNNIFVEVTQYGKLTKTEVVELLAG